MFLARFRLPGEAQKIDRIVKKFARKYYEDNREASYFTSHDQTYMLAFSAIMLKCVPHTALPYSSGFRRQMCLPLADDASAVLTRTTRLYQRRVR
jgi:hypothetical protein